jgi:hypothetical protein
MNDLETIRTMLGYKRPAGSKTERRFIKDWIAPLGVHQDTAGNLYKRIGDSPVMWSCHTDTVHRAGGKQSVRIIDGIAETTDKASNCLGADDTAGIWLMREMILAERPGLYVFHREEEIGGHGSSHIALRNPTLLDRSAIAVAFDRRGTSSIITHQWGGRCCSDAFAYSLGNALGMGHRPDDGGSFTDTANYTDLIGECTNLSVGYYDEHRAHESLDCSYLMELRDRLCELDGRDLIVERKPGEEEDPLAPYANGEAFGCWEGADQDMRALPDVYRLVRDYPAEVADFLEEYGFGKTEIVNAIRLRGGVVEKN